MNSRHSTLGRPTVRPPPPPSRNASQTSINNNNHHHHPYDGSQTNTLNRPQVRRTAPPPPPNVPPPPPPPSQKLIRVQLFSSDANQPSRHPSFSNSNNGNQSKNRAPPPPIRNTSISRKSLEARFGHMFKDIILLPGPEPFVGAKKIYPSKNRAANG